jgi:hypothetical protein
MRPSVIFICIFLSLFGAGMFMKFLYDTWKDKYERKKQRYKDF